jgi:CRAL/TRIO domain
VTQKVIDALKSGIIYHHGRDHRYRPIIVMRTKILMECGLTNDEIKLTLTYFIEYMLDNAILPGQVENWVIITDMDGVGITNVPYSVRYPF